MSSQNPSHRPHSLAQGINRTLQPHFTSPRHAQVLAIALTASVVLAGSTLAQSLSIPTSLDNSIIAIRQIFLSSDGLGTSNSTSTHITLDGSDGSIDSTTLTTLGNVSVGNDLNVSDTATMSNAVINNNLKLTSHPCPTPTGCVLTINQNGIVDVTNNLPGSTGPIGGSNGDDKKYFAKKDSTDIVDTGAYDIYFADPSITVANQEYAKVRIGIDRNGMGNANGPQLITRGKIESREGFVIQSPALLSDSKKLELNIEDNLLTKSTIYTPQNNSHSKALIFESMYQRSPTDIGSNFIFKGSQTSTKVGINTPTNSYPSKALDINGDTRSRGDLSVGGSNVAIRQAVGIPGGAGGIGCDDATIPEPLRCGGSSAPCSSTTIPYDTQGQSYSCNSNITNGGLSFVQQYTITPSLSTSSMIVNTSTRRVGINTATPTETLHVNGAIKVDPVPYIAGGSPLNGARIMMNNGSGTTIDMYNIYDPINNMTEFGFMNRSGGSLMNYNTTSKSWNTNYQGTWSLSKQNTNGSSTRVMTVDGSGNVGIGTVLSPAAKLEVNGSVRLPALSSNKLLVVNNSGYLTTTGTSNLVETMISTLSGLSGPKLWLLSGSSIYNNMLYRVAVGAYDFGSDIMLGVLGSFKVVDTNVSSTTYQYVRITSTNPIGACDYLHPQQQPTNLTDTCSFDSNVDNKNAGLLPINTLSSSPLECRDYYIIDQREHKESDPDVPIQYGDCWGYDEFQKVAISNPSQTAFAVDTVHDRIDVGFPINSTSAITTTSSITTTNLTVTDTASIKKLNTNVYRACDKEGPNFDCSSSDGGNTRDTTVNDKAFCALTATQIQGGAVGESNHCRIEKTAPTTWKLTAEHANLESNVGPRREGLDGSTNQDGRVYCEMTCF